MSPSESVCLIFVASKWKRERETMCELHKAYCQCTPVAHSPTHSVLGQPYGYCTVVQCCVAITSPITRRHCNARRLLPSLRLHASAESHLSFPCRAAARLPLIHLHQDVSVTSVTVDKLHIQSGYRASILCFPPGKHKLPRN